MFDASVIVSAALKQDSVPRAALAFAELTEIFALSDAVDAEIESVLSRPRFTRSISPFRRSEILRALRDNALWFDPAIKVLDCRDPGDNKYLELALEAGAGIIVSGDEDLLVLEPWRGTRIVRPADYLLEFAS